MRQSKIILILIFFFMSCGGNEKPSHSQTIKPVDSLVSQKDIVEEKIVQKANSACSCYNGVGSTEADKPILIFNFSNGRSISVCGYFDKAMQNDGLIMSEFNVFDCSSGESYAEYEAIQLCRIIEKRDSLVIQELKYLPVGKNWSWELIQVGEQTITTKSNEILASEINAKLEKFTINNDQQITFLKSLKKGTGFGKDWEDDLGKLEALSLLGNEKAWEILQGYENFTGSKTDGALAEQWKDALATVNWIKGKF